MTPLWFFISLHLRLFLVTMWIWKIWYLSKIDIPYTLVYIGSKLQLRHVLLKSRWLLILITFNIILSNSLNFCLDSGSITLRIINDIQYVASFKIIMKDKVHKLSLKLFIATFLEITWTSYSQAFICTKDRHCQGGHTYI